MLLIAELCNPEWESVPLVGWWHSQAIAARVDVHLVTHTCNRPALLRAGLRDGADFTAFEVRAMEMSLAYISRALGVPVGSNKAWTLHQAFTAARYRLFERQVWRHFRNGLLRGEFDLVHRLTPLSPTVPSLMAWRCHRIDVPFVLGPLNGGLPWPPGFTHVRIAEREWLGFVRQAMRLLPGYSSTRACASAILVGSRHTWSEIAPRYRHKTFYVPENGIDRGRFAAGVGSTTSTPGLPLRVAFVGRLVPSKGVDMLIEAAAPLARAGLVTLDVVGDGPERATLQALVAREQIAAAVRFFGWVANQKVPELIGECHVFAFPSIHDFGGGAIIEAMALGLVPLVVDHGGPGELVTARTGFALPIGSRPDIVGGLGRVLEHLAHEPSVLPAIGCRARERVLRYFTWSAKADQVLQVYDFVLGHRPRPDFAMPFPDQ